jgi:hypothetical protein
VVIHLYYSEFFSGITPFKQKARNLFLMVKTQIGFEPSQQTQFDIFHTKMLQIHQGVMLQLQYEYYAIFWKIFPMHSGITKIIWF